VFFLDAIKKDKTNKVKVNPAYFVYDNGFLHLWL
ncbi:MAG: hypothetical protein RIQ33_1726, partial [Bacteroidota bacterium]